ncbi:hypothetical protein J2D73_19330 [Acetobacter sacchari]|uniref:Bacterial CdiA-CT RNAse A domain-containing protein n=1 Tax=Acetobacter sacchari TaxID=2661687 RepID=A0ABS3M1C5_9PROT|nr:RNase A-like domain-containing protein [Acetobacter sacchari]MBO1361939.1 hypothetical protein [Acetobacter sacchari]
MAADANGEEGLTVVISPIQLAAILRQETISASETKSGRFFTRAFGVLQIVGGALELLTAGTMLAAPDPTMVTKAGAAVLGGHGADDVYSGFSQAWSGHASSTLTAEMARRATLLLGCRPEVANGVGLLADIAVPTSVASYFNAARVASVFGGRIALDLEETQFINGQQVGARLGHTISGHVDPSDQAILDVLKPYVKNGKTVKGKSASGKFYSKVDAEKYISRTLTENKKLIEEWSKNPTKTKNLVLKTRNNPFFPFVDYSVGTVATKASPVLKKTNAMTIVLKKGHVNGRDWFILTAYPSDAAAL